MTTVPFVPPLADPRYGEVVTVSPLIRRVVAHNPGKFTSTGTGTYVLGEGDVVVIDPGPRLDSHRDALAAALAGSRVIAVLVTHCHADHSPLARWLADETGAPTIGFGPHPRPEGEPDEDDLPDPPPPEHGDDPEASTVEVRLDEATDHDFVPDVRAADGDVVVEGAGLTITAVHTPGHTSNHLCFALAEERALFTGDHVMGWSTTVVAPPDGDMRAYIESLRSVAGRRDDVLWPTHGNPVTDPRPFLDALVAHRLEREQQVLDGVRSGLTRIRDLVPVLYAAVRPELHKPAARSVLAHLVKLVDDGLIAVDDGPPRLRSTFHAV